MTGVLCQQAIQRDSGLALGPWVDLGTGSGAIAIGLASLLKQVGNPLKEQ